ncbi:MAG TPA: LptE family protein [Thermoanaerobaculia bacterium]|nr:LptE family protein [Thermoanaerobaculia bacterium]
MKRAILWLAAIVSLSGCGYALVGRANFLPPEIRTVQVPAFINRTTRVELEQRVTQAIAEEMVSRGRLRLVNEPSEADVILRGTIQSFGINPVSFNDQGRATRYQALVTASIELVDHRDDEDEVLWKNDQYVFRETYEVDPASIDTFDQETRAIQQIAERFAESVVASLLENF